MLVHLVCVPHHYPPGEQCHVFGPWDRGRTGMDCVEEARQPTAQMHRCGDLRQLAPLHLPAVPDSAARGLPDPSSEPGLCLQKGSAFSGHRCQHKINSEPGPLESSACLWWVTNVGHVLPGLEGTLCSCRVTVGAPA